MHQALNKVLKVILSLLLLTTLFSCRSRGYIATIDYLEELAYETGISINEDRETILSDLKNYGVYKDSDHQLLNTNLTYGYMLDSFTSFTDEKVVDYNYKYDEQVYEEDALKAIDSLLNIINNKTFKTEEHHTYKENVKDNKDSLEINDIFYDEETNSYKKVIGYENNEYVLEDASFEEVYSDLKISSSDPISFDESMVIEDETAVIENEYVDLDYELLSSKRKVFSKNGYRISYKVTSGVIDFRISKDGDYNSYVDFTLSNITPSYKWDYNDGNINEAYFKINYNLTSEIGVSKAKKKSLTLDLSNLDKSSLLSAIKSSVKKSSKDVEATIKICTIKTPIPAIPLAYFNIDVLARVYVSGKIDIVATMSNVNGFEIKNNSFRFINDGKRDIDFNVEASARAVAGVNFNIEAASFRLMDLEVTGGVKASIKPIIHIYDSDGNLTSNETDLDYTELGEIADKNDNLKVCADVSLNWVLDIDVNTSKSLLYKFGLSGSKEILNKKNQILDNMTHLENGHFVKKCTRKGRNYNNTKVDSVDVNKIILEKYSLVINIGEEVNIPIKQLPSGYSNSDLLITSDNENVAIINGQHIVSKNAGATKINIETSDHKYKAYINVLVSTG